MAKITVNPTPAASYTFAQFVGVIDWATTDVAVGPHTPTGFTLTGRFAGKQVLLDVAGTGLSYDMFGLKGGTITKVSFSFGGVKQADIVGAINVAALRAAVIKDESGSDLAAIETFFMKFDWTYNGTNRAELAPKGAKVGDNVVFDLVGNDTINLNGGNDVFFSGGGNDKVNGGTGIDTLDGGLGNDILTGGAGGDFFQFTTAPNATRNVDRLTDFTAADTIRLDNAIFKKLGGNGVLKVGFFKLGAAADGDDYILYNKAAGVLSYDADGNGAGAAVKFATLSLKPTINNVDFWVI